MEAQAAAASAELAVAFLGDETGALVHVRAPVPGRTLDRNAALGASVEPGGEPLLRIGDPSALWLMVDVFVDDLPLVQEGEQGRPEDGTDNEEVNSAKVFALLQPPGQWRPGWSKERLIEELRASLAEIPGVVDLDLYRDSLVPQLPIRRDRDTLVVALFLLPVLYSLIARRPPPQPDTQSA